MKRQTREDIRIMAEAMRSSGIAAYPHLESALWEAQACGIDIDAIVSPWCARERYHVPVLTVENRALLQRFDKILSEVSLRKSRDSDEPAMYDQCEAPPRTLSEALSYARLNYPSAGSIQALDQLDALGRPIWVILIREHPDDEILIGLMHLQRCDDE